MNTARIRQFAWVLVAVAVVVLAGTFFCGYGSAAELQSGVYNCTELDSKNPQLCILLDSSEDRFAFQTSEQDMELMSGTLETDGSEIILRTSRLSHYFHQEDDHTISFDQGKSADFVLTSLNGEITLTDGMTFVLSENAGS